MAKFLTQKELLKLNPDKNTKTGKYYLADVHTVITDAKLAPDGDVGTIACMPGDVVVCMAASKIKRLNNDEAAKLREEIQQARIEKLKKEAKEAEEAQAKKDAEEAQAKEKEKGSK